MRNIVRAGLVTITLVMAVAGCEVIAGVDRSQIPNGNGGSAGSGGKEASSSSSSGMAGAGGTGGVAGAGGTGGVAGAGGTGGVAGAGGTGGVAGAGGGGMGGAGGGPTCITANDCGPTGSLCLEATCIAGVCGTNPLTAGTMVGTQTTGDCKINACDGMGAETSMIDDADLPDDMNDCTSNVCTNGVASNPTLALGTACGAMMDLVCNATGSCVGCNDASDCSPTGSVCATPACTANMCEVQFVAAGTSVGNSLPGDCQVEECDGAGNVATVPNAMDLPVDGNACTSDVCAAGNPSNPPVASGTTCNQNGGVVCDGAGACVQCVVASTCPGTDTECHVRTCLSGTCGMSNTAAGTPTTSQTAGDCKKNQCDGSGNIVTVNDNVDLPVDGNTCTGDVCTAGTPTNPPVASGTMCGTNGLCNATGQCVGCNVAADCPGQDSECQIRTCTTGVCGVANTAAGTPVASQTAGDCKKNQCDGAGNQVVAVDNADVPVDNNQCTSDVCTAGAPSNPPTGSGATCTQNGGAVCDGSGSCVQCVVASTCAGQDTECQTRTCNSNTCGFSFAAAGTAVASQTAGDCKQNQCDGSGTIVSAPLNTDVPVDNNQCTSDVCTAGAPSNPPTASGSACSQGGGSVCDGSGACIGCTMASQCPGMDNECQVRTCSAGMCGFSFTAAGTPVASQTAGDCKVNQCNGSGTIVSAPLNTDVPVDNNQCTSDVCTAGSPSNPPVSANTGCSQNGGAFCDGAGACVACTIAAQCPGMDTECQTRTCTAGACGFSFAAAGTAVASQTAGDCLQNQCDGVGAIVSAPLNTDVPVDGNQCTSDVCTAGAPSNPPTNINTGCSQNGGAFCDGTGACVACNTAAQCPGMDTECQTRTCMANTCGFSFAAAGTAVASQTAGDCQKNQCDGAGAIVSATDNADSPNDNNQCTNDTCNAGVPSFTPLAANSTCTQNGGSFCDGAGACVQCNAATQCPGVDTECQTRTCSANACGFNFAANGTPIMAQTSGDCQQSQCDGSGGIVNAPLNTDVPVDGNQCTGDVCTAGVPSNPPVAINTSCNQNGGSFCDGATACVQCNMAAQCPGSDTECQTRTCSTNTCGFNFAASGTPVAMQTANDCKQNQCDGAGSIVSAPLNTDLPTDTNQCTNDICTNGVPSNPPVAVGTPCTQSGGTACDNMAVCANPPVVVSTTPANNATPVAGPTMDVTFSTAMNPATLTANMNAGACVGNIQVSLDNFASCIAFAGSVMSPDNKTVTLTAAPGLLVNRTYKIRVTTGAAAADGLTLASQFDMPNGFTTTSPNLCGGGPIVISQVFGGGGNGSAPYKNDYVVLHNRGSVTVSLNGWSLQYAAATGSGWSGNKVDFAMGTSIAAGGYFLVGLGNGGGTVGATLPTADATGTIDMSATAGKVALVASTIALTGTCPVGLQIVDFVGFGATANCSETAVAPAPSNTTSILRGTNGCTDANNNSTDFATGTPNPRNSATAPISCGCNGAYNESNNLVEADYCNVQFPASMSVAAGMTTPLVYGRIFETSVTPIAGAAGNIVAQLGYGPPTANPQYQAGWNWTPATFNVQVGNNDEYQAQFTAPASGSYRYVYRFSNDLGLNWTYCDIGTDTGAGSNAGLSFEFADMPVLTVP